MAEGLLMANPDPIPEGQATFHQFRRLPQELQDAIWDAAVRNVYEPFHTITKENPRLFCMDIVGDGLIHPLVVDTRSSAKSVEVALIKGLSAFVWASRDSNQQFRRTVPRGPADDQQRIPLLLSYGYSHMKPPTIQLVMPSYDIICLDSCFRQITGVPVTYGKSTESALVYFRHIMLSMINFSIWGPQFLERLLKRVPHMKTLYIDMSIVRYNHFNQLITHRMCTTHRVDYKGVFTWLCDLPSHPNAEHDGPDDADDSDDADDGGGGRNAATQEGQRMVDYRCILRVLKPRDHARFHMSWLLCTQAGVKVRLVAQTGQSAGRYRQEEFLVPAA